MKIKIGRQRDVYAGLVTVLLGAVTIFEGSKSDLGTLREIGPGLFPVALGAALGVCGCAIGVQALIPQTNDAAQEIVETPDWRGAICIVLAGIAFLLVGQYLGFLPAAFTSVLIAALGDRSMTVRGAFGLAVCLSVAAVVVFSYALHVQFPLLKWGAQ